MINNKRIVPIDKLDLLTAYNMILNAAGTAITAIAADTEDGAFTVDTANTFCNEPAVSIKVTAESGNFYFVPAHTFEGMTGVTVSGTIVADGKTLYKGAISSGTVTVTPVTPGVPA